MARYGLDTDAALVSQSRDYLLVREKGVLSSQCSESNTLTTGPLLQTFVRLS